MCILAFGMDTKCEFKEAAFVPANPAFALKVSPNQGLGEDQTLTSSAEMTNETKFDFCLAKADKVI